MYTINSNSEITLFILWENARKKEAEILKEISKKFNILKKYEITWTPEKFLNNLSSFYSDDVYQRPDQKEMRGTGAFLVVLCEDPNPKYEQRETNHGLVYVNANSINFKAHVRKDILNGGFVFHSSDNMEEARHDTVLLTGKSISDILKTEVLDGETIQLKQDLPCVEGWKSMEQVFYVLNEACNYVVLWGADDLPKNFFSHKQNGDIDLMTDNLQRLIAILQDNNNLRKNAFVFYNWVMVGGEKNLFHAKYVGDEYFDKSWQYRQLESRVLNENGIYVLNNEIQFYSLLYHGLIHKTNYQKYLPIFKDLAPKINVEFQDEIGYLKCLLYKWMKFHKYKYTKHLDHGVLHKENVFNKKYIKKKPDFYIFQNKWGTSIIEKSLISSHPELATNLALRFSPFIELEAHYLPLKSEQFKIFKKDLKKNTLFVTYTKRYGKIGRTRLFSKKGKLFIKKDFIGLTQKVKSKHLILNGYEKTREFHSCKSYYQLLSEHLKNMNDFKWHMELFIQELFTKFEKKKSNKLQGKAFDMLPQNCIILNPNGHEYKFFDFEYEIKGGMDKSYMVYRCLQHLKFNFDKKEMYDYLCKKFNIPNTWAWCRSFDRPLNIFKDIEKDPLFFEQALWKKLIVNTLSIFFPKSKKEEYLYNTRRFLSLDQQRYERYFKS